MGHARQERVKLVGTRSADYIRASGHCGCIAMGQASTRKQAVYMAAPERFAKSQICSCNAGTVHTWPNAEVASGPANVRLFEVTRHDIWLMRVRLWTDAVEKVGL
jgi:hypothetical protein